MNLHNLAILMKELQKDFNCEFVEVYAFLIKDEDKREISFRQVMDYLKYHVGWH